MEPLIVKLAKHCIETGESYTRIARENGIGVGRLWGVIKSLKEPDVSDRKEHECVFEDFDLDSEIDDALGVRKIEMGLARFSNQVKVDDTLVVVFEDGSSIDVCFGKLIASVRMKGDIV